MMSSRIKILVSGSSGQLGKSLQQLSSTTPELEFNFLDKAQMDLSNPDDIKKVFKTYRPDYVINTAAYTQVDKAQSEREMAFAINEQGVRHLIAACELYEVGLVHISTDYVFDGVQSRPYSPQDDKNPQTVYGASKLAGEIAVLESVVSPFLIIRTSWLFSPYGHNFVKNMLRRSEKQQEFTVVNDQLGTPTSALDLARTLLHIVPQLTPAHNGVYHYTNTGTTSWYAFAKAIFSYSKKSVTVKPVSSRAYPTAAKRPKYSVLDIQSTVDAFGINQRPWEEALEEVIKDLTN